MSRPSRREATPSWGKRLDGIEGLRALAALSVVTGHTVILLRADGAATVLDAFAGLFLHGLTLFFVLSGFLLYRPWVAAATQSRPRPKTNDFWRNRLLRIWPAYVVILVVSAWVMGTVVTDTGAGGAIGGESSQIGRMTDPIDFVLNLVLLQGYFPDTVMGGLSVSWSLVAEVGFYLLLPALGGIAVVLTRRLRPIHAAVAPALLMVAVGLSTRIGILSMVGERDGVHELLLPGWATVCYRSVIGQADLFGLGMLAAAVLSIRNDRSRSVRAVALSAGAVAAVLTLVIPDREMTTPAVGVGCAVLIVLLRLPSPGPVSSMTVRVLETWPIRAVGLSSYSVYLWHFGVIWLLRLHVDAVRFTDDVGLAVALVATLIPTLMLASVTYRWVELPAMQRKRRTDDPSTTIAPRTTGGSHEGNPDGRLTR